MTHGASRHFISGWGGSVFAAIRSLAAAGSRLTANPKPWLAYAVAVFATALATAARWGLGALVGEKLPPFITFYPLVLFTALYGGAGPGLVATALACFAVDYFYLPPFGIGVSHPADRTALVLFAAINIGVSFVCGALRNSRRRTLAEARRAEASEERFRLFMDHTPTLAWVKDDQGRYTYMNKAYEQRFGRTLAECQGKTDAELWPPDVAARLQEADHATLAAGRPIEVTEQTTEPNGAVSFWLNTKFPVRDAAGRRFIASIGLDITDRKRFQEAVQDNEARLRLAIETAELGAYERNLLTNEVIVNEACRRLLGFPEGPLPPDAARKSVHPEDKHRVLAAVERAFNPDLREVCSAEFRIVTPQGIVRWVYGRGRVLFDDKTQPPRPYKFHGILLDITERKRLDAELQHQAAELDHLVQERTASLKEAVAELEHFSYTITHDMRAPLRAIAGYAGILTSSQTESLSESGRDLLRRICEASLRMDRLITDALQYSRVLRDQLPLQPIDPAATIRGIVESYPQFHPPNARITVQSEMPRVRANEAALTQVFSNLLGNAVKFVTPGQVPQINVSAEVVLRPEGPAAAKDWVRLSVRDNGIGIPPEYHHQIWEMFQRLSKGYEGTGIGLALVRKVVERIGGRVGLESAPGQGSCFWVELEKAP